MGFSLWDVFTIPFKHPEILKDNLADGAEEGAKFTSGLVTGDSYFPDNPKRQQRAEELAIDCQTLAAELSLIAPKIKGQLTKLNSDIAKASQPLNLPQNDLSVESHKFGDYSLEAAGMIGGLLTSYGVSSALTTAATTYLVSSGEIGAAAFAELVGLPSAFSIGIGAAAAGAAIMVVVAIGAIQGAKKRSELQDTIQDGVHARFKLEQALLVCKRLSAMLSSIQAAVDALIAAKAAGTKKTEIDKAVAELRRRIAHCKDKVEAEINNVDVSFKLAAQDKLRWSWTNEDPTVATESDLTNALSGSYWSYHWHGMDYKIHFSASGDMDLLDSWKGVRWQATAVDTVALDYNSGQDSMILKFLDTGRFLTTDWDGTQSSADLVGK